jgi:hypothetical protein
MHCLEQLLECLQFLHAYPPFKCRLFSYATLGSGG